MYVLYILYIYSSYILRILRITLYNLGYHSSLYSSIGSILDYAFINQLAASNSSASSRNIVLKASVTTNLVTSSFFRIHLNLIPRIVAFNSNKYAVYFLNDATQINKVEMMAKKSSLT